MLVIFWACEGRDIGLSEKEKWRETILPNASQAMGSYSYKIRRYTFPPFLINKIVNDRLEMYCHFCVSKCIQVVLWQMSSIIHSNNVDEGQAEQECGLFYSAKYTLGVIPVSLIKIKIQAGF
jgi:hypothetical protein